MRSLVTALVLVAMLGAVESVHAAPRPTLVLGGIAERTAAIRGTVAWPAGRPWSAHAAFRTEGARWRRAAVRGRRQVAGRLTGLRPATRYAVRLVITRCGGCPTGTLRSATRSFTTPAASSVGSSTPPASPEPPPAAVPPAPAAAPPVTPAPPSTFGGPVHPAEFPDPMVLRDGDTWFAYATGERFPMLRSPDLRHWTRAGTALAARPSWAVPADEPESHPWAPSVLPTDAPCPGATSGRCFVLFHVSLSDTVAPTTNCVGVATAPSPAGPFQERGILERDDGQRPGGRPVGCGDERGHGNIDPAPFVDDDGRAWLYVSTDWACSPECSLRPTVSVIPLASDLVRAAGPREPLFAGRADTWEHAPWAPVVENPWVVRRGSTYHLLFSGGSWQDAYGMGHATAPSPTGPFTRSSALPWAAGGAGVLSPGGGMVIADGGGSEWLAYHARSGDLSSPRRLHVDPLRWSDERPVLEGRPSPSAPVTG